MDLPQCAARCAFWIALFFCSAVRAETLELVTYYPTSSNVGDVKARSLAVGTAYQGTTPADGAAFIVGPVGIGTTSPQGPLHVIGELRVEGATLAPISFHEATYAAGSRQWKLYASFGNFIGALANDMGVIGASWLQVNRGTDVVASVAFPNGQVGIGTTTPGYKLEVVGSGGANQSIYSRATDSSLARLGLQNTYRHWSVNNHGTSANPASGSFSISDETAGAPRLVILAAGDVGIGTAAPGYKLDVVGSGGTNQSVYSRATDGSIARLGLQNTRRNWSISNYGTAASPNGALAVADETAGFVRLMVTEAGNVGIGTGLSEPAYKLEVVGSGGPSQSIYSRATDGSMARLGLQNTNRHWSISNYGTAVAPNGAFVIADETAGLERLTITAAGSVGIGTNTPAEALHVIGHAGKTVGGAVWADLSDGRLKKNIQPIEGALDRMLQLRGVTFEWKDPVKVGDRPGQHMGMIAQEVERVFPEWVSRDADGMRMVGAEGLLPLTIESFRELQQQNDRLRARLDSQEKELQALRKQMEETGQRS